MITLQSPGYALPTQGDYVLGQNLVRAYRGQSVSLKATSKQMDSCLFRHVLALTGNLDADLA